MPLDFHGDIREKLVGTKENKVFSRQIDLWWYAFNVGAELGIRTPLPDQSHRIRFNDGGILQRDPWRITHLELFVLAEEGENVAVDPQKVVEIANEYANTGFMTLYKELLQVSNLQAHLVGQLISE